MAGFSLTNDAVYTLGDRVELILQVDAATVLLVGPTCTIQITDIFGNIIDFVVADNIGDIYVAEWNVPLTLSALYNTALVPEPVGTEYFFLNDIWDLNGSFMSFPFKVLKRVESPIEENSVIQVIIDGITSVENTTLEKTALIFSTTMTPFYATIQEVRDLYREILDDIDNFTLARRIQDNSMALDRHMAPDYIEPSRQASYELARCHYVKYTAALDIIAPIMQISSESKELETFKISKTSGNSRQIIDIFEKEIKKYSLIIWAGGYDTPFITRRFEKGLFDPNRLVIGRARLDTSDRLPWVNKTSGSTLMSIDGDTVEVRGERTISLNANPRFDYSSLIGIENSEGLWSI